MMMKTADETKRGLEYLRTTDVAERLKRFKMGLPYAFTEEIAADALELIQQLEAQAPRWISVEENEKPRLRQDCLCICSYSDTKNHEWDYMMVLRWMGEGDNGYVNRPHFQHEGMNGMIVTHWMPLPEPPEA